MTLPLQGKTIAAGNGELCQGTDPHPEKPFRFACSAVRDGRLTSGTRLFSAASMPPSLQRPPHRGAGAEPRRALSPVSLASEKPGRRRHPDKIICRNDSKFSPPRRNEKPGGDPSPPDRDSVVTGASKCPGPPASGAWPIPGRPPAPPTPPLRGSAWVPPALRERPRREPEVPVPVPAPGAAPGF